MAAAPAVAICIVVLDEWQTDDDMLLLMLLGQKLQVLLHEGRGASRIAVVDVGIHVLHIYIILVDVGNDSLKPLSWHVERRLQVDVPLLRTELAKLHDEVAVEQGLAAA